MSILLGTCWQCEGCKKIDNLKPWKCGGCGKEICETCFWAYALCKSCCEGKTDEQMKALSGMDWDE